MIKDKDKLLAIHKQTHKSLVDFFRIFIGDKDDYVEPAKFHYLLSDLLLHDKKNFAIEMFRESGKSAMVLRAFPTYKLVYPSDDACYIVIIKQNQTLASAKLLEIINSYENHAIMNMNLISVAKKSADAIEVTVYGTDKKNHTVRIEAYGKGASIRGLTWGNLRPQVVIMDDIQDLEDSQSETVVEKDWDWFLSDVAFLAKTGRIFIIGNNLGRKCVIERIIDNKDRMDFQVMKIGALNEEGKSNWETRFSTQFLMEEKKKYTELGKLDIWYRERMCEAISPETQLFKQAYFRYFEEQDLPSGLDIDITIDPAISKKKDACNTAIVAVGKQDLNPNWYVLDYVADHLDPLQLIDAVFKMYADLRVKYPTSNIRVFVETVAYQQSLKYFIEEEMRKRREFFVLEEFKDTHEKEQRIKGLVPMYKTGVVYHRRWMNALEEELLLFPKGKTIDIVDALSFHTQIKYNTEKMDIYDLIDDEPRTNRFI